MKKLLFISFILLASCSNYAIKIADGPRNIQPELRVKWELFPDPAKVLVNPGEEILFKLTPKVTSRQAIKKMTLVFGDEQFNEVSLNCSTQLKGDFYKCQPIHETHVYSEDNVYRPFIEYEYGTVPEDILSDERKIIIAPVLKTDEELMEDAYSKVVGRLQGGIDNVLGDRKKSSVKFAFSSLKDANYEYNDKKDLDVIQKLTSYLVNKGYRILEKNSQALISLAHESVAKRDERGELTDEYMDSLEYGLTTRYKDATQPFYYGAKVEGVDDKQIQSTSDNESGSVSSKDKQKTSKKDGLVINMFSGENRENSTTNSEQNNKKSSVNNQTLKEHSVLAAKFATADYLIVIDRKKDIRITRSDPIFYNPKYDTHMVDRVARLNINARILSRDGSIMWINDLRGEAKDRVVPQFVKRRGEDHEKHNLNRKNVFKWISE